MLKKEKNWLEITTTGQCTGRKEISRRWGLGWGRRSDCLTGTGFLWGMRMFWN